MTTKEAILRVKLRIQLREVCGVLSKMIQVQNIVDMELIPRSKLIAAEKYFQRQYDNLKFENSKINENEV
ncbi:MAG: hypothetical protein M0R21_13665 [Lentimicrobiaceae bacterium]|jgi:hypothetical protein|nr:hypothetical protein [Lentimicrobiaceae bacterium]